MSDDRYSRQVLLPEIGEQGQRLLGDGAVLVVGCGALGSAAAELLVRAGVGTVRVADRDFVEPSNLQRQVLFDEDDAAARLPKAEAAARKLKRINSRVQVDGLITDVSPANVEALVADVAVVVDGTDNLETRYLLNDACVKLKKPWVYGGAVGTKGVAMCVVPGRGPCLRCVFPDPPPPGTLPTCDTVGVLGPAPIAVAALQASAVIKLLLGDESAAGRLINLDVWRGRFADVTVEQNADCPACGRQELEFLSQRAVAWVTTMCGRNSVQVTPPAATTLDLERLRDTLARVGQVHYNGLILTLEVEDRELVAFPDGRVIVRGTTDQSEARSLYAKYLGN
jgi:adenylyltransferase/sulfurtransferase